MSTVTRAFTVAFALLVPGGVMADDRLKKITDVINALAGQAGGPKGSLIVNGGFEEPVVRPGGYVTYRPGQAFTGWQVIGPSGGVSPISGSYTHSGIRFVAREGQQWLDLTGPSASTGVGVQQTVQSTPGQVYDLAFWVGNVSAGGFGTTSTVEVFVDGQSLGLARNDQTIPGQQGWGLFKMQVTATGNRTTVAFVNRDPSNDNSNGLDAVSLVRAQAAQASAAPEPADAPSVVAAPAPATAPAATAPDWAPNSFDGSALEQYGGTYSPDCANPAAPRLRATTEALVVEQGAKRMTGRNVMAELTSLGPSPPPDFRMGLLSQVRPGVALQFIVFQDRAGHYIKLDGDPTVKAALGKALLENTYRHCDAGGGQ